jgi:hypothetical protein
MERTKHTTEAAVVTGFSWVVEGVLAGSAAPGSYPSSLDKDLAALASVGITAVVSLNEAQPAMQPEADLQAALANGTLKAHLHLRTADYRPPTLEQMRRTPASQHPLPLFLHETVEVYTTMRGRVRRAGGRAARTGRSDAGAL